MCFFVLSFRPDASDPEKKAPIVAQATIRGAFLPSCDRMTPEVHATRID